MRATKFVPRKQWVLAGSDDLHVRVFNYNTTERVKAFEAHQDYIRSMAVHPTLPYLLTSSGVYCTDVCARWLCARPLFMMILCSLSLLADDMTIKLWDWDRGTMRPDSRVSWCLC